MIQTDSEACAEIGDYACTPVGIGQDAMWFTKGMKLFAPSTFFLHDFGPVVLAEKVTQFVFGKGSVFVERLWTETED